MKPTQQDQEQADRIELVYQTVLAQIGAKTAVEVLALWQDVPVGKASATAKAWLGAATAAILNGRGQAKELSLAYYRLVRALRTGTTIGNPFDEGKQPKEVSLEMLRQEFEALVAEHAGEGSTEINADLEPDGDEDSVLMERIDDLIESLMDDLSNEESYTESSLNELADYHDQVVDRLDPDMPNKDVKKASRDLHIKHGAMLAATGGRIAMNGGRNLTNQASVRDPRVIGWVRQSTTGSPCYWCAMLISRAVLYKSEIGAGKGVRFDGRQFAGEGMFKFHDNCKCTAVPVYSDADFKSNPKYSENRYYNALWKKHIAGKYSGNEAINEWRKLLRRLDRKETIKAAPEAA